ncbi:two-component regulator propeller domain-containing protein, partial [Bacteroidota bacterium]
NTVNTIFEDHDKNIWVGTANGLNKLKGNKNVFLHFQHDPSNLKSISDNEVLSIVEDRNGYLWIATGGGGLNKMDVKTGVFTNWQPGSDPNSISSIYINSLIFDHQNNLWLGTWNGLNKYNPKEDKFIKWLSDDLNSASISNNNINVIYEDNTSIIWIGTYGSGIDKFYNEAPKFKHYKNIPREINCLNNNTVWSLFEDHEEILWIGTDKGLNKFDRKNNQFNHFIYDENNPNSISENYVYCIYEDSENNLWVGTWSGGLNKFNRETEKFTRFKPEKNNPNSISSIIINTIKEDHEGNIWFGMANGIIKYSMASHKFEQLDNIPGSDNLKTIGVLSIFFDQKNNLWIGSDGHGLFKIEFSSNTISHFINDPKNLASLSSNVIFSIHEDLRNNIWIGTEAGLNILDQKTQVFTLISEKDGLPNDVVYGILANKENEIWLSTNNGLSQIVFNVETVKEIHITNYDVSDNLQSNEFNLGAYFQNQKGEMFFGGINGFNIFSPDSIKKVKTLPEIVITDFKISNRTVNVEHKSKTSFALEKTIDETKKITISHNQKILSFEFAALHYINPMKNKYAYKLDGFENDWKYIDANRRFVTYTNLDPGNYRLMVKATNNDGLWQEPAILEITITPPFWMTIWFYTIIAFLIFIMIRIYIKLRERNLKIKNISLEETVNQRTREISKQKKEITDSIVYSKHIQNAILPDKKTISQIIPNSFIFYLPREIIGGDFYWLIQKGSKIFIAVADCTGHGVPGALMSMLGITFLGEIVLTHKRTDPAKILNLLREKIISSLHQTQDEESSRDGMDISICVIDTKKSKLLYAGANQPITICNNGNLKEYMPDKMPIRQHHMKDKSFATREIELLENDIIYMYSDGYADQFGGEDGRKLLKSNFRKILANASKIRIEEQLQYIAKTFDDWKKDQDQIDDVLVLGFKLF